MIQGLEKAAAIAKKAGGNSFLEALKAGGEEGAKSQGGTLSGALGSIGGDLLGSAMGHVFPGAGILSPQLRRLGYAMASPRQPVPGAVRSARPPARPVRQSAPSAPPVPTPIPTRFGRSA